jgi:hypothetical protein
VDGDGLGIGDVVEAVGVGDGAAETVVEGVGVGDGVAGVVVDGAGLGVGDFVAGCDDDGDEDGVVRALVGGGPEVA